MADNNVTAVTTRKVGYQRGYLLGQNGFKPDAENQLHMLIPQLHALQIVISDDEWEWNGEIRQQLMYLAKGMAEEVHELRNEFSAVQHAKRQKQHQAEQETIQSV